MSEEFLQPKVIRSENWPNHDYWEDLVDPRQTWEREVEAMSRIDALPISERKEFMFGWWMHSRRKGSYQRFEYLQLSGVHERAGTVNDFKVFCVCGLMTEIRDNETYTEALLLSAKGHVDRRPKAGSDD